MSQATSGVLPEPSGPGDDDRVVTLSGLLDVRRAGEIRDALWSVIQVQDGDVVVDLTDVESMDATAVQVLAAAAVRLQRAGRHVVLRGCPSALRRLIACRGWRRLFVWERQESAEQV